jgi:hypothetical protein
MARTLHLEVLCGEKTCASEPGHFCRFLMTTHFGTRWSCHLFEKPVVAEPDETGWLMRLPECLRAEGSP